MQTSVAAGQEPPHQSQPQLSPDVRGRIAEAAGDPTLAPWQRQVMLEVARGSTGAQASDKSATLPSAAKPPAGIAADDGSWIEIGGLGRSGHTAIYDPVRDRMVVFGGSNSSASNSDVWTLSLAGSPVWSVLSPAGIPPSPRSGHTAIYDPVRDRMLVFGGGGYLNDVWALSLAGSPAWTELAAAGTRPSARYGHSAIYDPVRDRMLVFGGYDGIYPVPDLNDVWALSLAGSPAWSELTPGGTPPAVRYGHTAIYDPVRDRMVVLGGTTCCQNLYSDVWALSLAGSPAWSALPPALLQLTGHTAIYDPVRDRMVVFGGSNGIFRSSAYALSLAGSPVWSELVSAPSERAGHSAIYDPVRDRTVVFGGGGFSASFLSDVWALSFAGSGTWSELLPAAPSSVGVETHTAVYDPLRYRMLVFGGFDGSIAYNDVWTLSLGVGPVWSKLTPTGPAPSARSGHTAIYDPVRDRMLVFGGWVGGFNYVNDVWALSLAGSPAWSALAPAGTPPSARAYLSAIYDPVRDRMLVFGGAESSIQHNDVWALMLTGSPAWSQLAPVGNPPSARWGHAAIYDPVRDRMVVFGGSNLNDVWALSLAGSPAWSALNPVGTRPSLRYGPSAIYDLVRDRMVVFGGGNGISTYNDVWALSLAGGPVWSESAPAGILPALRSWHTAIYDPVRDRMLVFGGYYDEPDGNTYYFNDTWALVWGTPVSVPGDDHTSASRFALATPWPNPSRGPVTLDFTVPQAAHVSLVIYDAAGRTIRKLEDGLLPAGRHSTSWDSRDRNGRTVPAGIYLVRLAAPGAQVVRKAVVAEAGSH
jgi:predicted small integral membrane protein